MREARIRIRVRDDSGSGRLIAWLQKETSRLVSRIASPRYALNHWRSASIRLMAQIGTPKIDRARLTTFSNASSGGVSSAWRRRSARSLPSSSGVSREHRSIRFHAGLLTWSHSFTIHLDAKLETFRERCAQASRPSRTSCAQRRSTDKTAQRGNRDGEAKSKAEEDRRARDARVQAWRVEAGAGPQGQESNRRSRSRCTRRARRNTKAARRTATCEDKSKERRGATGKARAEGKRKARAAHAARRRTTRAELYEQAKRRDIPGSSSMSKAELARALKR